MSIGSWDPNTAAQGNNVNVDSEALVMLMQLSRDEHLDDLASTLSTEQQNAQQPLMTLGAETWKNIAEALDSDDILHLIRFFTRAEGQLSGWEAGAESPVIWLVKILRRRKSPPSRELLLWIKANSDNRFLPNGAL